MRTRAYTAAEKAIAAADTNTIRERWQYGLRLIHDQEKIAPSGGLRHGVSDALIEAARRVGKKLSAPEIRDRMLAARTYPKESQIALAQSDFDTWNDLRNARFPAYEASPDEPDADWRTTAEKAHDRAVALAALADWDTPALFPLTQFEPTETTLKQLIDYAAEQDAITERFAETGRKRHEQLDAMLAAVGGDESSTWADAHRAAFGDDVDGAP